MVLYEVSDGVATVTLNRPESLNSMDNTIMNELHDLASRVRHDDSIRVVVITGSGRAFCSGADLTSLRTTAGEGSDSGASGRDIGDYIADNMDDVFHPAIRAIADLPVPTIAKVNGVAAGGGMGLALTCDISVASQSAYFVCTFGPRLGIVPDLGSTWQLAARVGRAKALGIAMLGDRISAEQAEEWGLIWSVFPDEELDGAVDAIASRLKTCSPQAMTRIRNAIDSAPTRGLSDQLDVEREHQRVLSRLNMAEGVAAFLEKREPDFSGER